MSAPPVPTKATDTSPVRGAGVVAVDLGAITLLVALALVGLAGTFSGWQFLAVGTIGALLALLIVVSTLRLPAEVLAAALPLGALAFGGPVALREGGLGSGIPDLELLADVMGASVTGWAELLTTIPFVDLAGAPALVPYLLGFTGAGLAGAFALRGRSAGLPLLPLFAVLAAVLLLRRPQDSIQDWYPLGFVAVAVVWMVFRGLEFSVVEHAPVQGRTHGRVARAATAALVVVCAIAVSIPVTGRRPATAGASLRGQVDAASELAGLDSPLRRFRTFTKQPETGEENVHRKILFAVAGAPAGSRVRLITLDRYDGQEWLPGNDTIRGESDDVFLRMDSEVDNDTRGRNLRIQVTVNKAYRSAWVPTVGSLTSLRFLFDNAASRREQLRYNLATSTALIPVGIRGGDDYEFTSIQADDRLRANMRPWPEPVLSVEGVRSADKRIRKVLASRAPPMRKVFTLSRYLRQEGRFSDGAVPAERQYEAGHSLDRLIGGFLRAPRPVGNDEQYAAAMALLANRVGVPARVVVGAVVPRDGKVRGEDVHAWVELRVADGTWRTLPTREFMGNEPPRRSMTRADPPRGPRNLGAAPAAPTAPEVAVLDDLQDQVQAERRGTALRWAPWLLLLLLALIVPTLKQTRRGVRRHVGRPSDRMAGAWAELVDDARDLGVPVLVGATRPAQARTMSRAHELAGRADEGVFGAEEPDGSEVAEVWRSVRAERRALARSRRPLRRVWAPFNLASLGRSSRPRKAQRFGWRRRARR